MIDLGPFRNLRVDVADGVAEVVLDRPDVLNALDVETMLDLERVFRGLEFRRDVEALVVTGAGGEAFSSGADLAAYGDEAVESRQFQSARGQLTFDLARRVREAGVPSVARIDGYCIGAGLILAMYCDLRVAGHDAEFGLPTTALGMIPGGGATYRLVELVGEAPAKRLVLTGTLADASWARETGLVDVVADPGELDDTVEETVASIREGGRHATAAAKQSINRAAEATDRETAFEDEQRRWWDQFDTEERRRLRSAFGNGDDADGREGDDSG